MSAAGDTRRTVEMLGSNLLTNDQVIARAQVFATLAVAEALQDLVKAVADD